MLFVGETCVGGGMVGRSERAHATVRLDSVLGEREKPKRNEKENRFEWLIPVRSR